MSPRTRDHIAAGQLPISFGHAFPYCRRVKNSELLRIKPGVADETKNPRGYRSFSFVALRNSVRAGTATKKSQTQQTEENLNEPSCNRRVFAL
jgi:hypothetical protein